VRFLPATFWGEDDLYPSTGLPKIPPDRLLDFLKEAYAARSSFTHEGMPFPAHVQAGFGDWVRVNAVMQALQLTEAKKFVPPFIWFERLTHCVIVEFLHKVIAPDLDKERQKREATKCSTMAAIAQLSGEAKISLKRLADWTLRFDGLALIGPCANDAEWATDASACELRDSGLVGRDTVRGISWINDRLVGEAIGEHFYGSEHNPFRDCTILPPEGDD
jgi:hypothetical protein